MPIKRVKKTPLPSFTRPWGEGGLWLDALLVEMTDRARNHPVASCPGVWCSVCESRVALAIRPEWTHLKQGWNSVVDPIRHFIPRTGFGRAVFIANLEQGWRPTSWPDLIPDNLLIPSAEKD